MKLSDSQYDNELLNQIADESPTFKKLLAPMIQQVGKDDLEEVWLGSLEVNVPEKIQIQLFVTTSESCFIDED